MCYIICYTCFMNKRKDPRTKFLIIRITPMEKQKLLEDALDDGIKLSESIRSKLGFKKNG